MAEKTGRPKAGKDAAERAAARPKKAAKPVRAARPARAAKAQPKARTALPAAAADAASPGTGLRRKTLLERVAAASGRKAGEVREVVEATLAELGVALDRGETLNLPPLGKARVASRRPAAGGETLVVRLRRPAPAAAQPDAPPADPGAPDPLAEPGQDG